MSFLYSNFCHWMISSFAFLADVFDFFLWLDHVDSPLENNLTSLRKVDGNRLETEIKTNSGTYPLTLQLLKSWESCNGFC